jgi:serine/threonine-protein kinase
MEIDDTLPGAHNQRAIVYVWYEYDWEAAEQSFKRTFELDPDYQNAHAYFGWYLAGIGQFERAIAECQRAVEIDPLSLEANWILGEALYFAGRHDDAIEQNSKILELNPYYWPAAVNLARAYLQKGQYSEGIALLKKTVDSDVGNPWPAVVLGYALALAGEDIDAEKILEELIQQSKDRYISPMFYTWIHIGLGNIDQAFEWLDKSIQEHSFYTPFLKVFPEYDPLRNDPRFEVLLKKVGLID